MSVALVSPKDGLVAAVAERLRPDGKDYSRSWVVFPEKRPGIYLRKALAKREGSGFIPPAIVSIDGFVDRVYADCLGLEGRPLDILDAVAILFEIHTSAPGRLGGEHFLSADRFFPLGVKLFNDLEELHAAFLRGEELVSLDRWADESIPEETRNRLQSLSFFYERFYERVRERGFSTPASRFRAVAENLRPDLFADAASLIFAGFFSLTRTETRLFRTLMGWDNTAVLFLKGKGVVPVLESLGVTDPELLRAAEAPEPGPDVEFTLSPDTHGQVFALNVLLKDRLEAGEPLDERQVVVLPAAETLFPLYQQALSALPAESFNISLGYPLARTPIASFFDDLLELVHSADEEGRLYAPAYLKFVLHPYTKNIFFPGTGARADLTRILFHAIEEEMTARRNKAFWSPEEIEADAGVREAIQEKIRNLEGAPDVAAFIEHLESIHARTLAPFARVRDVGDFADRLIGVLDFLYAHSTARLHYFFHPYAEAFMDRLHALSRSLLRGLVFAERRSYFELFRKVVASGSVPFYGTPLRGLQVLGFWETRGIRFDDVTILDMNEEVLPSSRRADSLLPAAVRRALGLPTYRDVERRTEYYLDTLVRGASRVRVLFVENSERERSRFAEKLIWERQKREGEPRPERYIRTVAYRVALQTPPPGRAAKSPEVLELLRDFGYSATALDAYLSCPLRFYHAYVLRLREKEEVAEGMERKDIGTFIHSVLEEYFTPFVGRALRAEDLSPEAIGALVDRRFAAEYGGRLSGSAYLMSLQVRRHLGEFIADHQIPLIRSLGERRSRLRLLALERHVETRFETGGGTFRLTARMDRTETRGRDITVLDYKTGANEKYLGVRFGKLDPADRGTWSDAVSSFQVPLYMLICSRVEGVRPEDIHGRFLMLGKSRLGPEIEFSPFDEEDPEVRGGQVRLMERLLGLVLKEIVDPGTPFDPALARKGACEDCPYTVLCGRR